MPAAQIPDVSIQQDSVQSQSPETGSVVTPSVRGLSANALAFVGDAVFALFVRERLTRRVPATVHHLHRVSTRYVQASAQAMIVQRLAAELNDEELSVYRRGRNVKTTTMPKNADMAAYRQATGFEALLGYLHLAERQERLSELLEKAAVIIEESETLKR